MLDHTFPVDHPGDEKELLLDWLGFLRGAVAGKASVADRSAHWRPDGQLLSLIGIVNHLTRVEWRWIDGGFLGATVERNEAEFHPGEELTIVAALDAYHQRADKTDALVRSSGLDTQCWLNDQGRPTTSVDAGSDPSRGIRVRSAAGRPSRSAAAPQQRVSLRWVLLHLINETARHAGHADAVRELLDATTGE